MEFFGVSLMLGADIALGMLYRYWDSMKPQPLTFLEFFNFMYDHKQDFIKLLEEQNELTRKQLLNNYLETKDIKNLLNKRKNDN